MTDIDIDRYEHLGTKNKKTAHRHGLWHRTFSALAINPSRRRVVLQIRRTNRPHIRHLNRGGCADT